MDYTRYYEIMRRTSLLRGMADDELDTLMACMAPRARRYAKGELLLMAGYETHEVGLVLEGAITAGKPLADGSTVVMAHMGPGGVFADVLAGGRSRSPVNVTAAEDCLILYLPCAALLRPCAELHAAHQKLLQNWLETISGKYFALDRRLELICCKSLRGRICMWLLEQREACGADFPMIVKADSNGCGDLPALLRLYERCGVDGVEVSGIDFNRRARQKTPFYLDALKAAREGISIPLFPVGGVFSRGTAEEILAQGFPLVSMSRALICEPDFAAKLKSGAQDGSKCLACNGCYTIYRKRFVRCVQHQDEIEQFKTIPW